MVRDNRIKTYRFPVGSLVASAGGIIDIHTHTPLNGLLQAVEYTGGNYGGTGSLQILLSGTNTQLLVIKSGTAFGNDIATGDAIYPRAITRGTDGSSQSGLNYAEMPLNTVIRIIGSGLGNQKSGTGFSIGYI